MSSFAPGAQVFDVTVPFGPNIPGWPGQPATEVTPLSRVATGSGANVSWLQLSSHAGTHVDANWHFIDDGRKLLEIPVERWCGPCYVTHIPDDVAQISAADLEAAGIPTGTERLILRSRNSRQWEGWDGVTPVLFREDYVGVLPDAAQWLVDHGVRLVGTDSLSVGTFGPQNRETHLTLLGNDVLVIELLDLSQITAGPYELICLPLKLAIGDGAPARVVLVRS
ncbi:MAG: cyclase family protein [Thermomicrobiales bacterium]